jgi:hypothetical protein
MLTVWLAVIAAGLGGELVLGEHLVLSHSHLTPLWQVSQLLFALFVSIAVFSASPFGLPFAVLGLWKFGFPETLGEYRLAFQAGLQQPREALKAYLNGMGTTLHHFSASWFIVCLATRLYVPGARATLAVSLPLLLQHVFVLLR